MLLSKVCIYNNKIFYALDSYLIAFSYRKHESQKERFQEYFRIRLKCSDIEDIGLGVINNHVTGLKSLIIFVFHYKVLNSAFIFCNSLRKMYRISLSGLEAIENYFNNVFVTDGPTILVHSNNYFHLYYVPFGVNNKFDCQLLFPDFKEFKILQFQCFESFYNDISQQSLSVLVVCCNYLNRQSIKLVGFISQKSIPAIKFKHFSLHFFFPQCYESVLKSVQVIKIIPHFKADSVENAEENVEWIESMSVLCTKDDYLVFENAILIYCCRLSLPLLKVMCMKTDFNSTFLDKRNIVLVFENKTLFFLPKTQNKNCEVVKHWTDIEVVVTGDVLRKGSKQVILIKQLPWETRKNNCTLYDMLSFIPVDLLCDNSMPDILQRTTITGLQRKVQFGILKIKEIEHEISQKSAASIDALIKLCEFRMNGEYLKYSNVFQESLVNFILSKDENKKVPLECEPCIKLLEEKQRFIDNHWLISLLFINDGERSVCNPSIKVLMENNEAFCMQKLFINNSDNSYFCSDCNRQIGSKVQFNIILCFDISILYGEEEMLMNLTWYNGLEDEFDNEMFITEENKVLVQHQICLQIKISLADILNYKIKPDIFSPDDLLFARTLRQKISISLSSLHSDISRLEDMLVKINLGCMKLDLCESSSVKCIAFNNNKSTLFGTHIFFRLSRNNIIEMEAFIRNEKEMCLLIHFLYQNLPEDIIIFPCLNFKDVSLQLIKSLVVSMENEIDLLMSSFNIHNIPEEVRKNYPKLLSSQTAGTISISKETYKRIRTALAKKECLTDTIVKFIT